MNIPQTIHYVWLGNNPKSKLVKDSIKTWKKHAHGFRIVEWNEAKLENLMQDDTFYHEALKDHNYAFASDYARLEILRKYGGVYLDTDMYLLQNPSKFLKGRKLVLCFQMSDSLQDEIIETSFMACVPNHPLILGMLDFYKNMHYDKNNLIPNSELLGPLVFKKYNLNHSKATQLRCNGDVIVYNWDRFWQPSYKSVAIHVGLKAWGNHTRRDKLRIMLRKNINNRFEASIFQLGSSIVRQFSKLKS